jgi:hypothetical protein
MEGVLSWATLTDWRSNMGENGDAKITNGLSDREAPWAF